MFSQDVKGGKCIVDSRYFRTQLLQLRCPTTGESASQARIRCCPARQSAVGGQPVNMPVPRFAATEVPSAPCPNATRSVCTSNVCVYARIQQTAESDRRKSCWSKERYQKHISAGSIGNISRQGSHRINPIRHTNSLGRRTTTRIQHLSSAD